MKHLQFILWFFGALLAVVLALRLFMPFRRIWESWKKIAHKLGVFQTNLMLTVVYFLVLPIFVVLAGRKRLRLKLDKGVPSYWEDAKPLSQTLEDAGRPF